MSSRLFQEIREKRGLAYSVYSYHAAHADCGQFTIYLGTAPTQTKSVLDVWSDTIGELLTGGIHEEEFVHGKEQLKGGFLMSLESTGNRMNRLGKNELMLENHDSIETTLHKIEAIQKEDVDDLMRTMFSRPFAVACVGESDQDIQTFRTDQFVISGTN